MEKVGEHITLDIVGTNKEYTPEFYEKLEELFNKQNEFIKQNKPLPNWQAGTSF